MPRLSELTDVYYDPMGNASGALPVDQPFKSNEVEGLPVKFSDEPKVPEESSPLSNNVDKILNAFFRDDDKRLQLWPEKVLRAGATAAGKVASGAVPQWSIDKDTGEVHTSPQMIEKAQEVAALAGTGGLAGGGGSLNATPSLRPALKYNGKLYKGKPGQEHMDVIPEDLYPTFQKQAMSGEDITNFNFGFINDKGHFLSREDALKYGIDNGLIDPHAGKYGALTSTLMSDSSKPGVAIEAMKPATPFFSAVEHQVSQIPQAKMTGEQWLGTLSNKPGVKPEELQWTGLSDFLAENKGKAITKAQIEEHLASNKVELKEVSKGELSDKDVLAQSKIKQEDWDKMSQAQKELIKTNFPYSKTKYSDYQLPGGENYREMLLTLPKENNLAKLEGEYKSILDEWKKNKNLTPEKQARWDTIEAEIGAARKRGESTTDGEYKSSHWDEPNILAHVRMNDRTIDGKKSLHLEEIQSDWHQAGREKGYVGKESPSELVKQEKAAVEKAWLKESDGKYKSYSDAMAANVSGPEFLDLQKRVGQNPELSTIREKLNQSRDGVPDAPFKKNWSELAIKRMLREASENGYDRLSWTAGEHHPTNPKNLKQTGPDADKADKGMQGFYNDIIPKVVEKLGKEHGVKVKTSEVETNPKGWHLTPPEHTVSGKWMVKSSDYNSKGFMFNSKAEAEANLAQNIKGERGTKKIYYIDIPQSLKDTATQKGFPLFSKGGYMFQPVDHDPFAGTTELKT